MTGTEPQLSGRRHGRRARAVSEDEQNASTTRGVTGNLTLYARRTAMIPPLADDRLPELKHYTGKRAKRGATVTAPSATEAEASTVTVEETPAESFEPRSETVEVVDPLSSDFPASSVGSRRGSWPGALFGRDGEKSEPPTEPQTSVLASEAVTESEQSGSGERGVEHTEPEPPEGTQASAWISVNENPDTEDTSASEALAPKPVDSNLELAPVYETTEGDDPVDASEWLEVGDLPADQAPEPKPAARFEGTVLNNPSRTSGGIGMWITWLIVAAIAITLVVLLVTGVIGPGIVNALAATPETATFDFAGGLAS
ncbi:hypothetical protein M3B90_03365 [Dermabacter sp. p3-SID358]|uniref:hypothetical protein n=1 Tax=Dermabacter sp. p3-SID358 TaxID=2916114 RepID=UPI0021A4B87E|nr:hypothetical protein [Dermabacter sp. p3-SID358]MCT1866567.1 hypothetical protein [Dermabacter sp. p3-SID358]